MKRLIILLFSVFISFTVFANDIEINLRVKVIKKFNKLPVGTELVITKIDNNIYEYEGNTYNSCSIITADGQRILFNEKDSWDKYFEFQTNTPQELWEKLYLTSVLPNLHSSVLREEIQSDLEADANSYVQKLRAANAQLNDPILQDYVQSLVRQITPTNFLDKNKHRINAFVVRNNIPNAYCLPNGVLLVNSGLLACLHSEAELVAVLGHEIVHYLLGHAENNVIQEINRQERAAFWASFATIATAVAEIAVASHNDNYIPGIATSAVAILSEVAVESVSEYLGIKYNHAQETEADSVTKELLPLWGYAPGAMSGALSRISEYYSRAGLNAINDVVSETHPSLRNRIIKLGEPFMIEEKEFERIISFAVTDMASLEAYNMNYDLCIDFADQNINNGVAVCEDYLLKVNSILSLKGGDETYKTDVLNLIDRAKELNVNNVYVRRAEVIANLLYKQYEESIKSLECYIELLLKFSQTGSLSELYVTYINDEIIWAHDMIAKIKGLVE